MSSFPHWEGDSLFDPISLLNIHLPPRGGTPSFLASFSIYHFLLKKSELYYILQRKCIAKSAKYPKSTIIKCYALYDEFKAIIRREYLIIF